MQHHYNKSSVQSKRKHPQTTWLRKRTDQHNHAKKIPDVGVRPALTKQQQKETANNGGRFTVQVSGNKGAWLWPQWYKPLTNYDFANHAAGKETYYFAGNGDPKADETLFGIDIDCHEIGTFAGAVAFAEHLQTFFPNLYFERSTNGNGCHCYVVLKKLGFSANQVNVAYKDFNKWLKERAKLVNADISDVEIKGHCPEYQWANRDIEQIKFGQWIKYPRGDARNTTVLHIDDLARFPSASANPRRQRPKTDKPSGMHRSGSWMPHAISPFDLAEMPRLKVLASKLGLPGQCREGLATTDEDGAIFLLLLRFFTNHMNKDGTLPTARFEALWTALYDCGDIKRAWNAKRYAAIRNRLSGLSVDDAKLLTWEDETFCMGRACKWRASAALLSLTTPQVMEPSIKEFLSSLSSLDFDSNYVRPLWSTKLKLLIPQLAALAKQEKGTAIVLPDWPQPDYAEAELAIVA